MKTKPSIQMAQVKGRTFPYFTYFKDTRFNPTYTASRFRGSIMSSREPHQNDNLELLRFWIWIIGANMHLQ